MAVGEFIQDYRLRRSDTNIQTFPFFAVHFRQAPLWAALGLDFLRSEPLVPDFREVLITLY